MLGLFDCKIAIWGGFTPPNANALKIFLFGDGTLCCSNLLGGFFALQCICFSVAFLFHFYGFAMIASFVHVLC